MSVTITDIFAEARALVDADSTSYPDATLLRRVNQAGRELVAKFVVVNKNIKFDDANNVGLPIATFDLVNAQQAYNIGGNLISIDRVEVKDINGIWHKLNYLNENSINEALSEYKKTAGLPDEYARRSNSIFLYCPPSSTYVTLTAGGKIYYANNFSDFITGDIGGVKEPGIAQTHPFIFSYKAALPFAQSYKKDRVPFIVSEINRMEAELINVDLNKNNDGRYAMSVNIEDCR
jgi:hypothetical protein